jgi:PAS domain S-box-containing protein
MSVQESARAESARAAEQSDRLERLIAEMSRPLIGSDAFSGFVMTQCTNAARAANTGAGARRYERLARALSRMVIAPFAKHTVESLAAAAGMSRSSFAQCFMSALQRSPLDFLKFERLRFSAHLLCTTSLPVKLIASQVGYDSVSYFSRAFREEFGLAPGAVRNRFDRGGGSPTERAEDTAVVLPLKVEQQRKSEWAGDHLRLMCDATNDVMLDIDLTTGQVWWSEGMLPVFGYGRDQIGPDTTWCHEHIHPDDRQRVIEGMQRACANGDVLWRDRLRYRRADGSYAQVDKRGVIVRDDNGAPIRFLGTMQDISGYLVGTGDPG